MPGKFLASLKQSIAQGKIASANHPITALWKNIWVVYAKKSFGSPDTVLDYLGRYTHRVALSNDRIFPIENGEVTLSYRDRNDETRSFVSIMSRATVLYRGLISG